MAGVQEELETRQPGGPGVRREIPCGSADFDELASNLVTRGHGYRVRVRGSSMYPTIRDGDVVTVAPCEAGALRLGDIIFYRRPGGHVAHRLVSRSRDSSLLTTRGDAHTYSDAPFPSARLIGRVVTVEMNGHVVRLDTPLQRWMGLARVAVRPWRERVPARLRPLLFRRWVR